MRKIIGLIAVGLVLSVTGAKAQEASRRALAEELLTLMNVQENVGKTFAMFKRMIPAQTQKMMQATGQTNMPANVSSQQDKMMDMLAQEFSWDKLKDDYITLYAETFTEDEMIGAIAFYKSPAGQAFITKQPEVMRRSMELSQKMMMQIMPKIQAMTKELSAAAPAGKMCFPMRNGELAVKDTAKEPFYIDCHHDGVTLYPGSTNITWEALQLPDNAVEKLLNQIQSNQQTQYVVVMARPDSVKVFRQVRKMVGTHQIDVGYDVVSADFKVDWDAASHEVGQTQVMQTVSPPATQQILTTASGHQLLSQPPAIHIGTPHGQPMFFECRNEQVFYIDKAELDEKVTQMLSSLNPKVRSGDPTGFGALSSNEVGNAYYKVLPSYLLAMIMAIEPKPGVRGDDKDTLLDPNGKFQVVLRKLNSQNQYLVFLVRDDSFGIFRQAKEIAEKIGFQVSWELLEKAEPIKFGTGGSVVPTR